MTSKSIPSSFSVPVQHSTARSREWPFRQDGRPPVLYGYGFSVLQGTHSVWNQGMRIGYKSRYKCPPYPFG